MKIKHIQFKEHPVLGDLGVDFTDGKGSALDTIVFIGKNGTGKTKLLEGIVAEGEDIKLTRDDPDECRDFLLKTSEAIVTLDLNHGPSSLIHIYIPVELNISEKLSEFTEDKRGYTPFSDRTKKWFINISFDKPGSLNEYITEEFLAAAAMNPDKTINENTEELRVQINQVFETLGMDIKIMPPKAIQNEARKTIRPHFINKKGEPFDITQLSSGEKQVFFRAMSLRRLNIDNGIIIIDEPETSLHPEWQRKIMKVYQSIGENNQIIVATHSPFIAGSVPTESLRIMHRNEEGNIEIIPPDENPKTYGKSVEDILKFAMDMDSLREPETAEKFNQIAKLLEEHKYETEEFKQLRNELEDLLDTTDKDLMLLDLETRIRKKKNAKH